jgi:hypothetical protein
VVARSKSSSHIPQTLQLSDIALTFRPPFQNLDFLVSHLVTAEAEKTHIVSRDGPPINDIKPDRDATADTSVPTL